MQFVVIGTESKSIKSSANSEDQQSEKSGSSDYDSCSEHNDSEHTDEESKSESYASEHSDEELNGEELGVKELSDEEIIERMKIRLTYKMSYLTRANDFLCEEVYDHLHFLRHAYKRGSAALDSKTRKVGDLLANLGVTELFLTIWNKYFEAYFLNNGNLAMRKVMTSILSVLWNFTDISSSLCQKVFQSDIPKVAVHYLKSDYLHPSKTSEYHCKHAVDGLMAILFNMLQKVPESRNALREQNAVDVFKRFRKSPDGKISCKALFLQGYIINDDENEMLNSDDTNFLFIKKLLMIALNPGNTKRRARGFAATEIVSALNRLAVNDKNKTRIIVNAGLLPLYVQLLQPECSEEEQAAAVEGLWILAFKCGDAVKMQPGCEVGKSNNVML